MSNKKQYMVEFNVLKNGLFHRKRSLTLAKGVLPLEWKDSADKNYASMISNGLTQDMFSVDIIRCTELPV